MVSATITSGQRGDQMDAHSFYKLSIETFKGWVLTADEAGESLAFNSLYSQR